MSEQVLDKGSIKTVGILFLVAMCIYVVSWLLSLLLCKIMRVPQGDKAVYQHFMLFTNNGFLGFPVAHALFGSQGFFYQIIMNMALLFVIYSFGVLLFQQNNKEKTALASIKDGLKALVSMPVIASVIGLIIFFFQIPMHGGVHEVLSMVGSMMVPLSMIVIGIQLTESSLKQIITNWRLNIMTFLRLVALPALFLLVITPFHLDSLVVCILTISVAFPCATLSVILADEYDGNTRLAAEGVFMTTLFSMITLPIAGILLTLYVL